MKRILLTFTIAIAIIFSLFLHSCNQSKDNNIIGVVAPLSGENAHYGEILKNGFDLAFETDENFTLKYEDSRFTQTGTISAFNKLITVDKVQVVLGEVTSGNTLAIAPIAERNKVVLFATIATADTLRHYKDYFFRNMPSNTTQGISAANFLFNKLNIRSVAIFHQNSEFGHNIASSFKEQFKKLGGIISFDDSFLEGERDFRTPLLRIRQSQAEALFIPGHENEPALILRQSKELNLNIPIMGADGSSTNNLIRLAGNSSEGFYCTNVLVDKSSDFYIQYRDKFYSRFNKEPGAYDAYAYEGAMIILQALQNVGNNSEKVRQYLFSNTFESMTGELRFDENGEVDRPWGVYQIIDGSFTVVY